MSSRIVRHQELEVHKKALAASMRIFEINKTFPKEKIYSLTDQIRRSSRSVLLKHGANVVIKPHL